MSKAYLNESQVQQHAGDPVPAQAPAMLPGLGAPLLPADRQVEDVGELVIFDDDDVRQALKQFDTAAGQPVNSSPFIQQKRLAAMHLVLMFGLKLAAINLEIRK